MHVTRPPGPPALAILLPHPQLPRVCSSASLAVSSPRTPRTPSCGSNVLFAAPANRNSTDSWNSSNAADDLECEWKPEQVRLLSRTLDALPAHLVTPFNGPIPPSNLLDKIARGVSQAKGPVDWPHSIRATRVKLIELSRARAKEETALMTEIYSDVEMEDTNTRHIDGVGKGYGIKRPLYRQSSMDFMNVTDLRDGDGVAGLSDRLQRTDRLVPKTTYHPYSRRQTRLSSPFSVNTPSLINPSTPSSSTLNTLSSFSAHHRPLRRTASNLSATSLSSISMMSSNSGVALSDPRVQRVRRSDPLCTPAPPSKEAKVIPSFHKENIKSVPTTIGLKRAPSFGALAQEMRHERQHVFGGALSGNGGEVNIDPSYPSSDEEEKTRTQSAKKMRTKDAGGVTSPTLTLGPPIPNTVPSSPLHSSKRAKIKAQGTPPICIDCKPAPSSSKSPPKPKKGNSASIDTATDKVKEVIITKGKKTRPAPMNLQRNPSIFGAELPQLPESLSSSASGLEPRPRMLSSPPTVIKPIPSPTPIKTYIHIPDTPTSPGSAPHKIKTLRRVRRLAPGRRISFGSLVPREDADAEGEGEDEDQRVSRKERQRQRELGQLGSAFQLQ